MDDAPHVDHHGQVYRLTQQQAALVRKCCEEGYSKRAVAQACYDAWDMDHDPITRWDPPSNQYVGYLLCYAAARHYGEDPSQEPWDTFATPPPGYPPVGEPWPTL